MRILSCLLMACALHAAVIRGTVVEHQTGKYLSRVLITVQPVGEGSAVSMRTPVSGMFEFDGLPPGLYVVKASRQGFVPIEYGQKRWNSAGYPVTLEKDGTLFLQLRLPRWGAISGAVVDENEVGLPDHEVAAYKNTRPPVLVAHAKADDRGLYRIPSLEPGVYLVRTTGDVYEEGSYVPTFSKESIQVENARIVEVDLDRESTGMDVRPQLGKLFNVSGLIVPLPPNPEPDPPVPLLTLVTLATDTGRKTVTTESDFRFTGIPPGPFELYAQAPADDNPIFTLQGWYLSSILREDVFFNQTNFKSRDLIFDFRGVPANAYENGSMQLFARRRDLAGEGPVQKVRLIDKRIPMLPGRWEFLLTPPPGYYVSGFNGSEYRGRATRADGWNETQVNSNGGTIRFTLANSPGSVSGVVKDGPDPVAGAPVYLEAWDPTTHQRLPIDLRSTMTDKQGKYSFKEVPPGSYRILATFEYRNPDAATMETAGAAGIRVEVQKELQKDLDLYVIR